MSTQSLKQVNRVLQSITTEEGEGFIVNRPFPVRGLSHIDPFLLIDEMGPRDLRPGEAKGAPDHPHRGFETVTYMIAGEFEHKDSAGHSGRIRPGDVQWMTAGRGVVHSEMPSLKIQNEGGRMHGFQIWVNLPSSAKMMAPRYQEIPSERIPVTKLEDGNVQVKVIAGEVNGSKAVIDTVTPIVMLDVQLNPGATTIQKLPQGFTALVYIIEGEGAFGAEVRKASRSNLVEFSRSGVDMPIKNTGTSTLRVLILGGQPINEPVARFGPFVMNTPQEVEQAFIDFRSGRFV